MPFPSSLTRLSAITRGSAPAAWARSLPLWVSVGLVLLIAWQAVQIVWTLLGSRPAPASAPSATAGISRPLSPPVDVGAIVNAHLFGVAGAPVAGETDPASVAATQMNLVLVGTIASAIPEQGYAIVGESAQSARVYTVGKTITGGAKLHSVYPDRVILDRGGKLEALMLPKKFQGGGLAAATPPPPQTDAMLGERLRDLATQNPGAITEIIRPQPVFANGQQRGYRVYPGRNRQQFSKLGLMPGDLVTAINGTPLDDPARGMEILQSINSAAEVTVTVERNGQPTQVTLDNAAVAADAASMTVPEAIPVSEVPEISPDPDATE